MEIGSVIRKLRRERNITQEQLAIFLGVSACAYLNGERGLAAPDIS